MNISTLLKTLLLASDKNAIKLAEGTKRGGGRNLLVQVIGKYRVVRLQAGLQPGDNGIRSLSLSTLCLVLHQHHSQSGPSARREDSRKQLQVYMRFRWSRELLQNSRED